MKKLILLILLFVFTSIFLFSLPGKNQISLAESPPFGWLDIAEPNQIFGWAYDLDIGSSPISVKIYLDEAPSVENFHTEGGVTKTALADNYRSDLCSYLGSCNHGFNWAPPADLDAGYHIIRAFALSNNNPQLSGSPKYLLNNKPISGINLNVKTINSDPQNPYVRFFSHPSYDYAPTIMHDGNIYRMWWCSNENLVPGDFISYATSTNGLDWQDHGQVLGHEGWFTCDPSVIKINNLFYLYTTEADVYDPANINNIYLYISSDGTNWTKQNNGQPVLSCPNPNCHCYCVGQPSVLYKDSQFIMYFTDTSQNAPACPGNAVYIAYSNDGVNWTRGNNNQPVHCHNSGETKYSPQFKKYILANVKLGILTPFLLFSDNGINWPNQNSFRLPESFDENRTYSHNCGLLGTPTGLFDGDTGIAYCGAGKHDLVDDGVWNNSTAGTWDISAVSFELSSSITPTPTPTPTPPPSFSLSPGWNQIIWLDVSGYTATSALEDIDNDCGTGTAAVIATKKKDWWEDYVKNFGGNNFSLQNNQNYLIKVSRDCTWLP